MKSKKPKEGSNMNTFRIILSVLVLVLVFGFTFVSAPAFAGGPPKVTSCDVLGVSFSFPDDRFNMEGCWKPNFSKTPRSRTARVSDSRDIANSQLFVRKVSKDFSYEQWKKTLFSDFMKFIYAKEYGGKYEMDGDPSYAGLIGKVNGDVTKYVVIVNGKTRVLVIGTFIHDGHWFGLIMSNHQKKDRSVFVDIVDTLESVGFNSDS